MAFFAAPKVALGVLGAAVALNGPSVKLIFLMYDSSMLSWLWIESLNQSEVKWSEGSMSFICWARQTRTRSFVPRLYRVYVYTLSVRTFLFPEWWSSGGVAEFRCPWLLGNLQVADIGEFIRPCCPASEKNRLPVRAAWGTASWVSSRLAEHPHVSSTPSPIFAVRALKGSSCYEATLPKVRQLSLNWCEKSNFEKLNSIHWTQHNTNQSSDSSTYVSTCYSYPRLSPE